jgi:hypothetical protein
VGHARRLDPAEGPGGRRGRALGRGRDRARHRRPSVADAMGPDGPRPRAARQLAGGRATPRIGAWPWSSRRSL